MPNIQTYTPDRYGLGDVVRRLCKSKSIAYNSKKKQFSVLMPWYSKDFGVVMDYPTTIVQKYVNSCLLKAVMFNDCKTSKVVIIGHPPYYPGFDISPSMNIGERIGGIRDFSTDMTRVDATIHSDQIHFYLNENIDYDSFENGILLNPYGNWFRKENPDLYMYLLNDFFPKLSIFLSNHGFKVYTNCANENQSPLPSSEKFSYSITDTISIVPKLKAVISVLTGFAEMVMLTGCNLFVLADHNFRENMSKWCNENYIPINVTLRTSDSIIYDLYQKLKILNNPLKNVSYEKLNEKLTFISGVAEIIELCESWPEFFMYGTKQSCRIFEELNEERRQVALCELDDGPWPDEIKAYFKYIWTKKIEVKKLMDFISLYGTYMAEKSLDNLCVDILSNMDAQMIHELYSDKSDYLCNKSVCRALGILTIQNKIVLNDTDAASLFKMAKI